MLKSNQKILISVFLIFMIILLLVVCIICYNKKDKFSNNKKLDVFTQNPVKIAAIINITIKTTIT